jgi:hypothetical protein
VSAIIAYGVEYLNIQPILPEFKNKKEEQKYRDELKCKLLKYSLSNDSKKPAKNLSIPLEQLSILEQVIDKF